jgi:hypothetical protein
MDGLKFELGVFGVGLGFGLLITLASWFNGRNVRSSVQKEVEDLRKHLNTQMSITAKGYEEMRSEIETLRKTNENLRVTVATLSNKPGRAELRKLYIWDKAIKIITLRIPGFAPAWEMAIDDAKKEIDEIDSGVKALFRQVFPLASLPHSDGQTPQSENLLAQSESQTNRDE